MASLINKFYTPEVKNELSGIVQVAIPLVMTSLWSYLLTPVSLMFCGHLGTTILDGVSIAGSLINISGIAIVTGLSAACDTFFSQTFGSGNMYLLGIYLQRSVIIIFLALLPCIAFLINSHAFLILIAQDEVVASIAADYLNMFLFGLPGCFAFVLFSKYLQNQDILYPTIIIGAIGNGLNAVLHYILVWVVGFGYDGSAYAQAISFDVMGIMSVGYIMFWKVYDNQWPGWGRHSILDWGQFMRLAIPSLVMICVESWTIEVGVFLSALAGLIQQSSQSVLFQIQTITDMLTIGFGAAASIRVGQNLGRGSPKMAKTAAILSLMISTTMAIIILIVLSALSWVIPYVFTHDPEVVPIVARLLPFLGLYAVVDSIACTSAGIVRGCGRQTAGSLINVLGYYGISLPVGIPLMLIYGVIDPLWYALVAGLTIASGLYMILILTTDWEKQAKQAAERCNIDAPDEEVQAKSLITSFAGRRTTWATTSDNPVQNERKRRNIERSSIYNANSNRLSGELAESTFSTVIESNDDETAGLLSGKPNKVVSYGVHTTAAGPASGDEYAYSRNQFVWLISKRALAFFICIGVVVLSVILRVTVLDYVPIFEEPSGNLTTTAIPGNYSSTSLLNLTSTVLPETTTAINISNETTTIV